MRTGLTRLLSWQSNRSLLFNSSQDQLASSPLAAAAAVLAVIQQSQQQLCGTSAAVAWQLQRQQHIHTNICAAAPLTQHIVQLDRLRPAAGSTKLVSVATAPSGQSCAVECCVSGLCSCRLWCTRLVSVTNPRTLCRHPAAQTTLITSCRLSVGGVAMVVTVGPPVAEVSRGRKRGKVCFACSRPLLRGIATQPADVGCASCRQQAAPAI